VFFHAMGAYDTGIPPSINQFLSYFGLVLFTLTSAYKFHYQEVVKESRPEYLQFIKKRAIRLLKPYYGFSLLALPMLIGFYSFLSYLGDPTLLNQLFQTMQSPQTYVAFIFGNNFIATQLWYLIVLLFINAIVGFAYMKYREPGITILFPLLIALAYFVEKQGNPLASYIPMNINIVMNTIQFSLVFIIGIVIAKVFCGDQKNVIIWLLPACIGLLSLGYWLFVVPILFFLVVCFERNDSLFNRGGLLGKYSFQIYLFHLPVFLFAASLIMILYFHMNNLLGLALAIIATLVVCIFFYELTKKLRLNILFE
jgi:peptidoglycan/LPS O-acetylase OafA/YrhL